LAAESHVDRSINGSKDFIKTNVEGTRVLLDCSVKHNSKFHYCSTDEVYGDLSLIDPSFTEKTQIKPSSPYSASKAAGGHLVHAYHRTYNLHTIITRCSNNYGPYQFPEKLIPLMITNAIENKELPIYGDGLNVRDWIAVKDHCLGMLLAIKYGVSGEVYNFGGEIELQNIAVVRHILKYLGMSYRLIKFVKDRPGHDRRYAVNCNKSKAELGWFPSDKLLIDDTIEWYKKNKDWWEKLK